MPFSARRYKKKTRLRACRLNCYSLSAPCAHRHETKKPTPSVCCLPIYPVRHVNNVVSQRGSRPACCTVDVDWLNVWFQFVVKARDEDYKDAHLKDLMSADSRINTNLEWPVTQQHIHPPPPKKNHFKTENQLLIHPDLTATHHKFVWESALFYENA